MGRAVAFAYGLVVYVLFLGTLAYAVGFVANLVVPKTIDSGATGSVAVAILINSVLLGLFAVQHLIMARPAFKTWWTQFVPRPVERSTFVLAATLLLALMMWQWRPLTGTIWHVENTLLRGLLFGVSFFGWGLMVYSSFLIDHFDLFGLRQVWLYLRGQPYTHHPFVERSVYKLVRHPLMVGFLIAFWATPDMTVGHLLFAVLTTAYIIIGVQVEERDLLHILGQDYEEYRRRTPKFIPRLRPAEVTAALSSRP